jgi:hypothetical protein
MTRPTLICGMVAACSLLSVTQGLAAPHGGGMGSMTGSGSMPSMMGPSSAPARTTTTAPTHGPTHTGQPNQSCQAAGSQTPGGAANAPGSAFNTSGKAGTVYAGQQPQNSQNTASVSQYDVACTEGGR